MKRRFVHPNVRLWLWLFSRALLFIAILEKRKESYSVPKAKKKEYVAKCLSVYLLAKVPMRAVPVANFNNRPAGRCLQLVRPIRGKGMIERVLILLSPLALIRSPGKHYITDIRRHIFELF